MELSWHFRISYYLNKEPSAFRWLVKTLSEDTEFVYETRQHQEIKRVLEKYNKTDGHPECLIVLLCQHLCCDVTRETIEASFRAMNPDALTNDKHYNATCPTQLVLEDVDHVHAQRMLCQLMCELSGSEIRRVKMLLAWNILDGRDCLHVPYGWMEEKSIYELAPKIVNYCKKYYKCVMFAILNLLDRRDLLVYLGISSETVLAL